MAKHEVILRFRKRAAAEDLEKRLKQEPLTAEYTFGRDGRNIIFRYDTFAPAEAMLKRIPSQVLLRERYIASIKDKNRDIANAMKRDAKKREITQITYCPPNEKGIKYTVQELAEKYLH